MFRLLLFSCFKMINGASLQKESLSRCCILIKLYHNTGQITNTNVYTIVSVFAIGYIIRMNLQMFAISILVLT